MANKEITIRDHIFEEYITNDDLLKAIQKIADKINDEYKDYNELPVFLIVLSGAMFFGIELLKKINFTTKIGFVKCSSYSGGTVSSGKILMKIEPTIDVNDKEVIVLEDIVDTGLTWKYLHNYLNDLGAKKVRIASLLIKEQSIENPVPVDWAAIKSDNKFVIGMGLDYGELGRNLTAIYKLKH